MLSFVVGNCDTHISNIERSSVRFINELNDYLSFKEQGFQFTWRYKKTPWNGNNYLLNGEWKADGSYRPNIHNLKFRTGLLPIVLNFCKEKHEEYIIVDNRLFPEFNTPIKWEGTLRDYQIEAVDQFFKTKRGILSAATGSGKSLMITNIVARANLPSVILCGTIDLAKQMKSHFEKETPSEKVGFVGDGTCDIRHITISTWQSAAKSINKAGKVYFYDNRVKEKFNASDAPRIKKMLADAQFIIIDESHCARANMVQSILKYSNAPYILGTSATPTRDEGDDLLIRAELGDIFYNIDASYLIKKGWLVRPHIDYYYVHNDPLQEDFSEQPNKEFHAIYRNYIVENEERNNIICTKAREMISEGRKVLILVDYLDTHGKILEKMLKDISAEFLHARHSSKKRDSLITAFQEGKIDCMIATSLADEGLDLPILSGEILAGGKRGKTKVKQRIGRSLRPYDGKSDARIIDFLDDGKFVLNHSIERIASLKAEPLFKIRAFNIPKHRQSDIIKRVERKVSKNEQRDRYRLKTSVIRNSK